MFALSFMINQQIALSVVLTNVLSCIQFYSPHYICSFYHGNFTLLAVTHHQSLEILLPTCTWERDHEEDNFICTKCEHLRNTQQWHRYLSMPSSPVTISHYFWVSSPALPQQHPFRTALEFLQRVVSYELMTYLSDFDFFFDLMKWLCYQKYAIQISLSHATS